MNYIISTGADYSKGVKTVIYGVEGIGKTTLAAKFPDPLFIDTEGSTSRYETIKRLPAPKDWKDINDMIDFVSEEKPCQTLVIDTFDWAERAEVDAMLAENKWKSIETPGYGKGYVVSAERIAKFLSDLETKLIDKGINVILNCHSHLKKFESPEESGQYDRYELKLGAKTGSRTAPLVKEWADMILFCNFKTYVEVKSDGFGNTKAKATGGTERVMYTQRTAVWDAKNRFGLPEECEMSFKPLAKIFKKKEEPKPEPKPEPAQEPKKEKAAHITPQATFPEGVPELVIDLCKSKGFYAEDIQTMLYTEKIVKSENYDLSEVPSRFWDSFVNEFEERWKEPMENAQKDNLPF